jgi:hypothetical protein
MSFVPVAAHRKTTRRPFCGKAAAILFGYATRARLLPLSGLGFPWFAFRSGIAAEAGVADRVSVLVADAHHLTFTHEAFKVLVAPGVVPWLRSAPLAVEMARVLRSAGLRRPTSDRIGVRLNARLQRMADGGVPWIRSGGGQYLVLARAPIRAGDARP